MSVVFYNIFLVFLSFGLKLASLFNPKAKKWVVGRKDVFKRLSDTIPPGSQVVWMHCASLGEFEQGRPLFEKLKERYPGHKFLLTFFSPSGYEIRKNYSGADWVFYLPLDSKANAKRFLDIVNPSLVIFVKYEYWYYYLKTTSERQIPLILISALFRNNSVFFKWYGSLQRRMLGYFDKIFVQNETSRELLSKINLSDKVVVTGDTRFDRVIEIAENATSIALIEQFIGNHKALIAGSTWPADEDVLKETFSSINNPSIKLILAPHEVHKDHIAAIQKSFTQAILYSELTIDKNRDEYNVLIIDNIGMLSRLYRYAFITYIGGGFGKGIHNTLEAAVYGRPVIFGPVYHKFQEAKDLMETGGGFSIKSSVELTEVVTRLIKDEKVWIKSCQGSGNYVLSQRGATEKIVSFIQENRLLTN